MTTYKQTQQMPYKQIQQMIDAKIKILRYRYRWGSIQIDSMLSGRYLEDQLDSLERAIASYLC